MTASATDAEIAAEWSRYKASGAPSVLAYYKGDRTLYNRWRFRFLRKGFIPKTKPSHNKAEYMRSYHKKHPNKRRNYVMDYWKKKLNC